MDLAKLKKISEQEWEIPKEGSMRVPGRIYGTETLVQAMDEKVREQVRNVAELPGLQVASFAMPDAHWGYGFPIGGVAAFDDEGVFCMGGVGYDISCGVRALRTGVTRDQVQDRLPAIAEALYRAIPAGQGSEGRIELPLQKIDEVLQAGAPWAVENGYGTTEDIRFTEELGRIDGADPSKVSHTAKKRQYRQIGTLGSGNHYLEVQEVDDVFDPDGAKTLGLGMGSLIIAIHCGSRALGHQIGTDYLKVLGEAVRKYGIAIRDRELACAPIKSPEGSDYFAAMNAGINYALTNRFILTHISRDAFEKVVPEAKVQTIYDVSHNTCKKEVHTVDGQKRELYVHRKGATRALGPGWKNAPAEYEELGQPVLIGGSMGTASYVMVGTPGGMARSFGSACHGAGRAMSRTAAAARWRGQQLVKDLAAQGIIIKGHSMEGLAEEAPGAYKDVGEVVDAVHAAGLAKKIVRVRPVITVKG